VHSWPSASPAGAAGNPVAQTVSLRQSLPNNRFNPGTKITPWTRSAAFSAPYEGFTDEIDTTPDSTSISIPVDLIAGF
jgi:hypothetical protein